MATITIPATGRGTNPFVVMINGVRTELARGSSVECSNDVKAEVQRALAVDLSNGSGYSEDTRILPVVDASDNGKFLGVGDGKWGKVNSPLPSVSASDNGKILAVVEGQWAVAEVPESTAGETT